MNLIKTNGLEIKKMLEIFICREKRAEESICEPNCADGYMDALCYAKKMSPYFIIVSPFLVNSCIEYILMYSYD